MTEVIAAVIATSESEPSTAAAMMTTRYSVPESWELPSVSFMVALVSMVDTAKKKKKSIKFSDSG